MLHLEFMNYKYITHLSIILFYFKVTHMLKTIKYMQDTFTLCIVFTIQDLYCKPENGHIIYFWLFPQSIHFGTIFNLPLFLKLFYNVPQRKYSWHFKFSHNRPGFHEKKNLKLRLPQKFQWLTFELRKDLKKISFWDFLWNPM